MGHFKSFLLGLFTAYGIYYITKKAPDGNSILDDLLANTGEFMNSVKNKVMHDAAQTIKDGIS